MWRGATDNNESGIQGSGGPSGIKDAAGQGAQAGHNTEGTMKGFILYLIGVSLAVKLVSMVPAIIHGMCW